MTRSEFDAWQALIERADGHYLNAVHAANSADYRFHMEAGDRAAAEALIEADLILRRQQAARFLAA